MSTLINLIIVTLFALSTVHIANKILLAVERTAIKRIEKGLSKSEPFAQKLTGTKLNF